MTLIVGIRCTDGVVVGTDSAMTFASGQDLTIEQPLRQKIEIVQNQIIVAGTGELGLGQRFIDIVKHFWKVEELQGKSSVDIGRRLAQLAIDDFSSTRAEPGSYGALVAVPCAAGSLELIEFSLASFQPEVKTRDNWYVSMGSGQYVADPLLGFIRRTFWKDDPPSHQDGIFATTMVLELGCEMAPTGVAKPIQIAVLNSSKDKEGEFLARHLTKEELLEHRENFNDAISHFQKYRDILHGRDKEAQPFPVVPPS